MTNYSRDTVPLFADTRVSVSYVQGWAAFGSKTMEWALIAGKASVAIILLMGLIPFLFGVLLDLVVLTPVRVPLNQSPIYFLWQVGHVQKGILFWLLYQTFASEVLII